MVQGRAISLAIYIRQKERELADSKLFESYEFHTCQQSSDGDTLRENCANATSACTRRPHSR
eukprot:scaffold111862_cov31-Prasinocladus_malaysianus.AAC.2